MARTMSSRNAVISSVIDCIRINLLFNQLRIYPLRPDEHVDDKWVPPDTESSPEMRAKEYYFGKFAENALSAWFVYGFPFFAVAEVEVDSFMTPITDDDVVDQEQKPRVKRGRPSNAEKNKVLVPFVPSDNSIHVRMRMEKYARPEVFFLEEMGPGFLESDTPKKIKTLIQADVDMPDERGRLRSAVASLIRDAENYTRAELCNTKANFANCSPIAVVRHQPVKENATEKVDGAALAGEQSFLYMKPVEEQEQSVQQKVDAARQAIRQPGQKTSTYDYWQDPYSQIMDPIELRHPIESGLCLLPPGVQMDVQPLLAQAPPNLDRLHHQLVLNTCARFHVPPSFMFYGSGRTTTIASESEKMIMVNTVKRHKENLEDLMQRIYQHIYGESCKIVLKACPMQTPELFEKWFQLGLISREELAKLLSEAMNVQLHAQPESAIPVVLPINKASQYVVENAGKDVSTKDVVTEIKQEKKDQ